MPWVVVSVEVWLPVVAFVLLPSDWLPVVVVLSRFNVERPRRSMLGLTVEVDPFMLLVEFAVDPVTDDVVPAVEPVVLEGDAEVAPDVLAEGLAPLEEDVPELAVSGAQSSCTGLAECSFASPVDLSASLPAFGWAWPELPASRLLHGGRLGEDAVELRLEGCVSVLVEWDFAAYTGAAIMAATASALMNRGRIILFSSWKCTRIGQCTRRRGSAKLRRAAPSFGGACGARADAVVGRRLQRPGRHDRGDGS